MSVAVARRDAFRVCTYTHVCDLSRLQLSIWMLRENAMRVCEVELMWRWKLEVGQGHKLVLMKSSSDDVPRGPERANKEQICTGVT